MIKLFSLAAAIGSGLFVGFHPVHLDVPTTTTVSANEQATVNAGATTAPVTTTTPVQTQPVTTQAPQPSSTTTDTQGQVSVQMETTLPSVTIESDAGVNLLGNIQLGL